MRVLRPVNELHELYFHRVNSDFAYTMWMCHKKQKIILKTGFETETPIFVNINNSVKFPISQLEVTAWHPHSEGQQRLSSPEWCVSSE